MPKLPRITGKELIKVLQKEGFEVVRQKGSHAQVRKFVKDEKITFPVPIHTAKILKQGTLEGILRKADISINHLNKLLKK